MQTAYDNVTKQDIRYITVGEFLEALEKNGYKHIRGTYVREIYGTVAKVVPTVKYEACAIGQAAINLKVNAIALANALNRFDDAGNKIIIDNDDGGLSYKQIVANAKEILEPYKDKFIPVVNKKPNVSWMATIDFGEVPFAWAVMNGDL